MHEKDRVLIKGLQEFFGGIGYISKPNKNSSVEFRVSTLNDLVNVIIPHFDNYPLYTKKRIDYLFFKQIVTLMLNKEHNSMEGIQKAVNIRASINTGLSHGLKEAFPNTIPVDKSTLINNVMYKNIPSEWLAGFATGESNFFIAVQKSLQKNCFYTSLCFSIAQHSRDYLILQSFAQFFGGGSVTKYDKRQIYEFVITNIDLLVNNVIPFFDKYPILGSKHLNFLDFKSAAHIIKNKLGSPPPKGGSPTCGTRVPAGNT